MSHAVNLHIRELVRNNTAILRNISWEIGVGEHWVVLGPNGAGKSTLLAVASGYDWHCQGQVAALGKAFGRCDMRALRGRIGWVSAQLLDWLPRHQTARQIVASGLTASVGDWYALHPTDTPSAEHALQRVGAQVLADTRFGVLSQGEKQRVMIARALVTVPELLILDEPCAGLDAGARELLLRDINELCAQPSGPTLILSSHHLEEIPPVATHALLLKEGRVLASGQLSKVLTDENIDELYGVAGEISFSNGRYGWRGNWT